MRVVFFGSPESAIPSLQKIMEDGHKVELIVTQPDRPSGRGKRLTASPVKRIALEKNIPVLQPGRIRKDPAALATLSEIMPDLNAVVAYGQIIPASIIYMPKHNSINLHFSLLPKYRGASPVQWAILNGESTTGLTIFKLNEKMDEGDILTQREIEILPRENAFELEKRLAREGADLLAETIDRIDTLKPMKQDHAQATYAPLIKKEDGLIDWKSEAISIDRKVRAFTPWPSAFTHFRGKRIKILDGKVDKAEPKPPIQPGAVCVSEKEGLHIRCGDGHIYIIERLQPENRKAMSAHAYSLGANIKPGDTFE
ncbi:MAG: methionyl-tRNA formyltransferase [Candidatus Aminicenantes bacterium]|jgi:methionyl-tRNA formyltransferase